jgi:hypothetical protein
VDGRRRILDHEGADLRLITPQRAGRIYDHISDIRDLLETIEDRMPSGDSVIATDGT